MNPNKQLKFNAMKKKITSFLKYIELETSIVFDIATLSDTYKDEYYNSKATFTNYVYSRSWSMSLGITSSGPNRKQKIDKLDVYYEEEFEFNKAFLLASRIKSAIPDIPMTIVHAVEGQEEYYNL
jgi:hypothetical protein